MQERIPWTVWAAKKNAKDNADPTWQIKTYVLELDALRI